MNGFSPTEFLDPGVTFENPHIVTLAALHYALGSAAGELVGPLGDAGGTVSARADDAASGLGDHDVLQSAAEDGLVRGQSDTNQLSVDAQLAQDGTISGHIGSGESQTANNPDTGQIAAGRPPDGSLGDIVGIAIPKP